MPDHVFRSREDAVATWNARTAPPYEDYEYKSLTDKYKSRGLSDVEYQRWRALQDKYEPLAASRLPAEPRDTHGLIVKWHDDDQLFVARILEADWCTGHGITRESAIKMCEDNFQVVDGSLPAPPEVSR
jgi:hypothetical protein